MQYIVEQNNISTLQTQEDGVFLLVPYDDAALMYGVKLVGRSLGRYIGLAGNECCLDRNGKNVYELQSRFWLKKNLSSIVGHNDCGYSDIKQMATSFCHSRICGVVPPVNSQQTHRN